MKQYLLIGFVLLHPFLLKAQLQPTTDPPLTTEQKWLVEKNSQFYKKIKKEDAATQAFVKTYKQLLAANVFCSIEPIAIQNIKLKGSRINENNTILQWDVLAESKDVRYVIERRYADPFGTFDSIGAFRALGSDLEIKNYQSLDYNTFSGRTYYRLLQIDADGKVAVSKTTGIEGYNNKLNVFPNPAPTSAVTVNFIRFDTEPKTQLMVKDGKGSTLYVKEGIYLNGSKTYRLENLNLPKGTYFLQATNASGTGGTTFIIN